MASPKDDIAQSALKPLTPQEEAVKALLSFEEAMKILESGCCLYMECCQYFNSTTFVIF